MTESKNSYKFILYISKIYSIPVFKPLVEYLTKTSHVHMFYVSEKVRNNFPDAWDKEAILGSLKDAQRFNPDFVLVSGNFVDFRIPGIKVQLFHGLGVEKEVHYKIRHFFDVYLTSGPFVTERFNELQKKHIYFLVKETGWPKIDYIINFPQKNAESPVLPKDKKIILYAPTFSTNHQSATALIHHIPQVIKDDEFWLIKFHELMNKEIIESFKSLDSRKIMVIENSEITPYLHAADVLISDTSSVIYEFMVLDKPIVTFRTKGAKDKGIDINSESELRQAVDSSLHNPDKYKLNRQKHISLVNPYIDGKISQRIIDILSDIKNENLLQGKRKPLNLFRKFQVIYHSFFRKGYLR